MSDIDPIVAATWFGLAALLVGFWAWVATLFLPLSAIALFALLCAAVALKGGR